MRHKRLLFAVAVTSVGLSACGTMPAQLATSTTSAEPRVYVLAHEDISWTAYLASTRAMSFDELRGDVADVAGLTSPVGRLQLAMLLAAPQNPARDDQAAQSIAQEVAGNRFAPVSVRDAAALFAQLLDAQRHESDTARRAQQRSMDDMKRIEQTEARARDLERRAVDAERKLEALKQIEKTLNDRAPSTPASSATSPSPVTPEAPAPRARGTHR